MYITGNTNIYLSDEELTSFRFLISFRIILNHDDAKYVLLILYINNLTSCIDHMIHAKNIAFLS